MAALSVMLAAVGSLCGAIEREAVDPALYGEKSRAAVAHAHGLSLIHISEPTRPY